MYRGLKACLSLRTIVVNNIIPVEVERYVCNVPISWMVWNESRARQEVGGVIKGGWVELPTEAKAGRKKAVA